VKLKQFNTFCARLPHATHVVQWGGSHVWKIGGRVFALASVGRDVEVGITFKCSRLSYDLLKDSQGLRPAPYLASRGMSWIQWMNDGTMDVATLKDYLRESYRLASLNLTRKVQRELGLNPAP
jgi:predicted DNA-binding protein (MmcQ/YjbR family)